MKRTSSKFLILFGLLIAVTAFIVGIRFVPSNNSETKEIELHNLTSDNLPLTISDRRIQTAQNLIEKKPSDPQGYNLLCAAFIKKARETGDFGFNAKAEIALNKSFELANGEDDYDAIRLKAMLELVNHRFNDALETAKQARDLRPNDPQNYGAMTDALIELGDYTQAFKSAQTMMNMRPGTNSYTRVSYLRELQGDTKGAIEAMQAAAEAAPDPETLAWCRTHLGDLLINSGKISAADHEFDLALFHFPEYHLALAGKARARVASGDFDAAIEFYKKAQERVPLPETAIALGDLYAQKGNAEEAKKQYDLLEFIEQTSASAVGNTYSRQLALFYADHDLKLDDALAIAERERAARSDIYTCDALAWCLYKKGNFAKAEKASHDATRIGTRDARIKYHAGMIENALGNKADAAKFLKSALEINPEFDVLQADVARRTLEEISISDNAPKDSRGK